MTHAHEIVEAARRWIGAPYQHQGRSPHGIDCVGLLIVVGRACGIFPADFDYADYGRHPTGALDLLLQKHLQPGTLQPGAVVSIRWWRESHHVGIVAEHRGALSLIHSLQQNHGVREQRLDERMRQRISGVWAYPVAAA